jgi:hypothetical protein
MTEGVPEHDVGVGNLAVCLRPLLQSIAALALIGKASGRKLFFGLIRRDPNVIVHKSRWTGALTCTVYLRVQPAGVKRPFNRSLYALGSA